MPVKARRGRQIPRAGIPGGCDLPAVGVGNQSSARAISALNGQAIL